MYPNCLDGSPAPLLEPPAYEVVLDPSRVVMRDGLAGAEVFLKHSPQFAGRVVQLSVGRDPEVSTTIGWNVLVTPQNRTGVAVAANDFTRAGTYTVVVEARHAPPGEREQVRRAELIVEVPPSEARSASASDEAA